MKKIILTGGGTAGHIMPNIALLPELRKHFDEILYFGESGSMEERIAKSHGLPFYAVPCVKFSRSNPLKNLAIPKKLSQGVRAAKNILEQVGPAVIFSKGGFAALPTVLAAHKLKVPVVIHESDTTLGLANRLSARKACAVLTAAETKIKRAKVVGNPIRKEIFEGDKTKVMLRHRLDRTLPTLLIVGGSSGALAINRCVYSALPELSESYNVIHIAGNSIDESVTHARYSQIKFSESIQDYYAAADIIVSRSGAIAAEEICSLQKRVLFIPLPKGASRGDQIKNAQMYERLNLAMVLEQEQLNPSTLLRSLKILSNCKLKFKYYDPMIPKNIVAEIVKCAEMHEL